MAIINNRYTYDQAVMKPLGNGEWGRGIDQTFQREVVLYTFQEADAAANQEASRWLSKASQMSSEHFMHILDAGSENGMLFAVLQAITGGPLVDRLAAQEITGLSVLAYVYELTKAIRETRVLRLPECAVDVENLWVENNGRLRVINYWSEGKIGRRGVPGLALLLYQWSAKTDIPTSSTGAYAFEIRRLFAELPEATRDRAVAWACKGYEGKSSLAEFQQELEVLLGIRAASATAPQQRKATAPSVVTRPTGLKSLQLRKSHLFIAASCVSLIVLIVWLSTRANPSEVSNARPEPTATPVHTAAAQPSKEPLKPTASAPASAAPDPTAAAPTENEVTAPSADDKPSKAGVVPDLVAHTKEDAVKMAMAAGLRYQFFLESNEAASGMVFKQDLMPGNAVNPGDRITFWVSKGK